MTERTYSLVVETNNLHGEGAGPSAVRDGLLRLLTHLRTQTWPLARLRELVITHDGLSADEAIEIERAAGRSISFVEVGPAVGYYAAKNRGFNATSADVVAFADADCWPNDDWLAHLFAPFADDATHVVAGRTTYRGDILGIAATTIDFMYFTSPLGEHCTRNFYANNVAFRRAVFEGRGYLLEQGFYRGNCQVLGLALQQDGVKIVFEPRARTIHRAPDTWQEAVRLRLLRGADSVELAPHLAKAYVPDQRWVSRVPGLAFAVLGARWSYSVRALGHQDMPAVHGARWLACVTTMTGISLLDGVGAALKTAGLDRLLGRGDDAALSYHREVDGLAA